MQESREALAKAVEAGTEPVIDIAKDSGKAVVVTLRETHGAVNSTGRRAIEFEGETVENALDKLEAQWEELAERAKRIRDALVEVVR